MIIKTLLITCELFDAAVQIQKQLDADSFTTEFLPRLRQIHANLAMGPNPEISTPLVDALDWGFHHSIQPTMTTIIQAQGFDWRFITGRRRPFKQLASGQPIPTAVSNLWQLALAKSTTFMATQA